MGSHVVRNRIRRLRLDHDEMTQQESANSAGCPRQTIIAIEQGKYVPSLELAFRIARVFEVPVDTHGHSPWHFVIQARLI